MGLKLWYPGLPPLPVLRATPGPIYKHIAIKKERKGIRTLDGVN